MLWPDVKHATRKQVSPASPLQPTPEPEVRRSCGRFRKCEFADGVEKWIVVLNHPHAEGDRVWIERRDEEPTLVIVGPTLTVSIGGKVLENCHVIAPTPRCDKAQPKLVALEAYAEASA
jgi:hypothetical protein